MNNPSTPTGKPITPEWIACRKAELKKEISEQKARMAATARNIFAPLMPRPSSNPLMRRFNKGLAVFDGVMIGFKIIRTFRRLFGRR